MDLNQRKPHDMGPPLMSNSSNLIVMEPTTTTIGKLWQHDYIVF